MPFLHPPTTHQIYTVEQANAALPLVRSIMKDVIRLERKVRHTRTRLKFIGRGGDELAFMFANEIGAIERELHDAQMELKEYVRELMELGIEPEGLDLGLVDFPSILDNETVYLCWRFGESTIEFWHTLTGGFPERRPIRQTVEAREPEFAHHS